MEGEGLSTAFAQTDANNNGVVSIEVGGMAAPGKAGGLPEPQMTRAPLDSLMRTSGKAKQVPDTVSESVWKRMTQQNPNAYVTASPNVGPDAFPYPKWPPGHSSAAFESVAVKKSYILSPAEIYAECAHHGEEKAKYPLYKMLVLTMIAGCYVGFGFTLCLLVGGAIIQSPVGPPSERNIGLFRLIFGAVGFPFAFTTIVVCGAELYTSLCAYMAAAWWEGTVSIWTCLRVWVVSWCGNFAGCGIFVGLMYASGIFEGNDKYLVYLALVKTHHKWGEVFVRGIFANWLVGIATWMANAAQDLTGKAVGIWLPISAFAMIGFEHCIANQFVLPMGIAMGAELDAKHFIWYNLIPATLGNWVGGAVCLATVYALAFGRPHVYADECWAKYMDRKKAV